MKKLLYVELKHFTQISGQSLNLVNLLKPCFSCRGWPNHGLKVECQSGLFICSLWKYIGWTSFLIAVNVKNKKKFKDYNYLCLFLLFLFLAIQIYVTKIQICIFLSVVLIVHCHTLNKITIIMVRFSRLWLLKQFYKKDIAYC